MEKYHLLMNGLLKLRLRALLNFWDTKNGNIHIGYKVEKIKT